LAALFVDLARGNVALQVLILGATFAGTMLLLNGSLGLFSGQAGSWPSRNPQAAKYQSGFLSSVLAGLAVRLVFLERPTTR
jgi:threonine/homoserine/homoserine lactone efflux protein